MNHDERAEWITHSACKSADPTLFDLVVDLNDTDLPEPLTARAVRYERAALICQSCIVLFNCHKWAEAHPEIQGVMAGAVWTRRTRGRPIKLTTRRAA